VSDWQARRVGRARRARRRARHRSRPPRGIGGSRRNPPCHRPV